MYEVTCLDSNGDIVTSLTQWDTNQSLIIEDSDFDIAPIFHFCNKNSERALGVKSVLKDGSIDLSEVGLCARDYINREVNASLSGGELKRIEIAMALARSTKLTVFDEPEAGIDLWSFQNLIEVFEKMHEKINGSIIIISHQERILDIADKIVVISDGKITAQGTKEEILPEVLKGTGSCKFYDKKEC